MHWTLLSHVHLALGGLQCVLLQDIYHNSLANLHSGVSTNSEARIVSQVPACQRITVKIFRSVLPYPGSNKTTSPPSAIWPLLCFIKYQGKPETFPRIFTVVVWTAWNFELPPAGQTVGTLEDGNLHRQSLLQPHMQNVYLSISSLLRLRKSTWKEKKNFKSQLKFSKIWCCKTLIH